MSELTPLTGEALNTLRGDFAQSGTNRLAMNAGPPWPPPASTRWLAIMTALV